MSFGQVKAPSQKRRAVIRAESAETQDHVSAPPVTSHGEQKMEAENVEDMEELSFAASEPRWAVYMCDNKCRDKDFKFFEIAAFVSEEGDAARTTNLCKQCFNERRAGGSFKVEGADGAEGFSWEVMGSFWFGTTPALNVGTMQSQKKRGPNRSWKM